MLIRLFCYITEVSVESVDMTYMPSFINTKDYKGTRETHDLLQRIHSSPALKTTKHEVLYFLFLYWNDISN